MTDDDRLLSLMTTDRLFTRLENEMNDPDLLDRHAAAEMEKFAARHQETLSFTTGGEEDYPLPRPRYGFYVCAALAVGAILWGAGQAFAGGWAEPVVSPRPTPRPAILIDTCRYVRPDGTLIRYAACERVNDHGGYREPPREPATVCDGGARDCRPGERPTGTTDDPTGFIDREPDHEKGERK